ISDQERWWKTNQLFRPPIPVAETCQRLTRLVVPMSKSNTSATATEPSRIKARAESESAATETITPKAAGGANRMMTSNHGRQGLIWKVSSDVSSIDFLLMKVYWPLLSLNVRLCSQQVLTSLSIMRERDSLL